MPSRRGREDGSSWKTFLEKAPLTPASRRDLLRLYEEDAAVDPMPGLSPKEKEARLAKMSYQDYLVKHFGVTPEAFTLRWLESWKTAQPVNSFNVPARPSIEARWAAPRLAAYT